VNYAAERACLAVAHPPAERIVYTLDVLTSAVREAHRGATVTATHYAGPYGASVVLVIARNGARVETRSEGRTLAEACRALAPWTIVEAALEQMETT